MRTAAIICGVFAWAAVTVAPSLDAELACETALMVVRLRAASDKPDVTTKCENCRGTGKLGDGKISVTCQACNGTGKPVVSVLVKPDCERCGL